MLLSRLPDHRSWTAAELIELLESLQHLPLAIAQAASYINEEDVTVARYLELLRPGNADSKMLLEQDYYDSKRHADIHNSVFQTWRLSLDQIRQQVPRAVEILSLMCVLYRQSISRKLLQDEGESQVILDRALATLKNFSLIQEEKIQQTYEIHRLVQLSTQWWLEQEKTLKKWQERALDVLRRECPSSHNVENWKVWESLRPHITIVQGYHFGQAEQKLQYADITSRMGGYSQAVGRYTVALKMEEEALTIRRGLLGKEHPSTLTSMNNLAGVLNNQGKYSQAEEMHRQELRLCETVLGKEHPNTLTSMNNLAKVLGGQGKYEQAEEMHRQVLRLRETVVGKEHPDTLTSMNNLARVLNNQGKYEQAEEMHRQVLRLYETVLGKEHPNTLTSVFNLAYLLGLQQRVDEARPLYERALAGFEKTLGSDHPTTQACREHYLSMANDIDTLNTEVGR
jgi:tetratricopeptide (TPR) repeat protein